MNHPELYVLLLGIIVLVGIIGKDVPAPTPLLLVIAGMLISAVPAFPSIQLNPDLVFDIFLPLLVYESSTFTSWRDVLKYKRPIALLSIGHVIFITILVAVAAHAMIPAISWPMAFVLGAVISPPDDVAIISIADQIQLPKRILVILSAESILNDATALTIFRLAIAALVTHQFILVNAIYTFTAIVICETLYGFFVGHVIGQLRLRISSPMIQMLLSILTPFLAYLPSVYFGGSGVLATVVTGFVIGNVYLHRFVAGARLMWRSVWQTIGYTVSSILFLLVGLNLRTTLNSISLIPVHELVWYGLVITFVVIVGRFIWVYPAVYLPRYLFPKLLKNTPNPPWQYAFIVSWAGMRGGVSLAAALAVPALAAYNYGSDLRDILVFLVFCVITATLLIQGLTLPWLIKKLGIDHIGRHEKHHEQIDELHAKVVMVTTTLDWLQDYAKNLQGNDDVYLLEEVALKMTEYAALKKRLSESLAHYEHDITADKSSQHISSIKINTQIIELEKETLSQLWHEDKISLSIRNKLLHQLDLRAQALGTSHYR